MTARTTIAAALCWYDEPPASLERMVASLAGFADILVSLDGPYSHFPHADPSSPREQHRAIDAAARIATIPHAPMRRTAVLPTQAAKRTRLYRAAASVAGPIGWVLIIDADETLTGDLQAARERIARIGDGFDSAALRIRTRSADAVHPRMLRALDGLTCGPEYHGMLSATGSDGRRVSIRDRRGIIMGENPRPRRARELDVSDLLAIHNDTDNRPDDRKAAKREYVRRRTLDGIDL